MTEDRQVLREVAWQEVFPGTILLSAWKIAIGLRPLVLASIGVLVTWLGWLLVDNLFDMDPKQSIATAWLPATPSFPTGGPGAWWLASPIVEAWHALTLPFTSAFSTGLSTRLFGYFLICSLWAMAVWAFFGGAITRLAAVQLTRQEKLSWGQTLGYARSKWPSYFAAPLFPMFGVLLAAIPLAIVGLLLYAGGFGIALAGILWPLVLFAGFVMAILLVGLFFNWPLMWPTISTEGTDSFDALSRSYAYSFQRPLRYAGYLFVLAVVGVLAWLLVTVFAGGVLTLSQWAVERGGAPDLPNLINGRDSLESFEWFGASLIYWCIQLVGLITRGFVFSYFFVGATAVYLLLRLHVDATETDEVFLSDEEDPRGLPPLTTDSAGVVQVADGAIAGNAGNGSPEG